MTRDLSALMAIADAANSHVQCECFQSRDDMAHIDTFQPYQVKWLIGQVLEARGIAKTLWDPRAMLGLTAEQTCALAATITSWGDGDE